MSQLPNTPPVRAAGRSSTDTPQCQIRRARQLPGSITVCLYCAIPLEFTDGMALQVLDMDKLDTATLIDLRKAMGVVLQVRALHGRRN